MAQEGQKAYTEQYVRDIANAIRSATGSQEQYRISDMGPAIEEIQSADGVMTRQITDIKLPTAGWIPDYMFGAYSNAGLNPTPKYIQSVYAPSITVFGEKSFQHQSFLHTVDLGTNHRDITVKDLTFACDGSGESKALTKFGFSDDNYIGITTSSISNNDTTNPIIIDSVSVTAKANDIVFDSVKINPYKWNGSKWVLYYPQYKLWGNANSFKYQLVPYLNFQITTSSNGYPGAFADMPNLVYIWGVCDNTSGGPYSMNGDRSLQRIDFDENVLNFTKKNNAFSGCTSLKILKLPKPGVVTLNANTGLGSTLIGQGSADARVYVPADQIENYKITSYWSTYYDLAMQNNNQLFYDIETMPD